MFPLSFVIVISLVSFPCFIFFVHLDYLRNFVLEPGYPPQPVGTAYSSGAATTTTVVMQPATTVVHAIGSFGNYPANITCPSCRAQVVTSMSYSDGLMVWLVAGGLCIVG